MENLKDIRWKQRFSNYEKSFNLLSSYIDISNPGEIERAGGIQFFEMTFELAWKTLKDYLEAEGFEINSPRGAIKQAFQSGVITEGHSWIDGLDDRNLTVHTYNEKIAKEVEDKIRNKYYPILKELYCKLQEEL